MSTGVSLSNARLLTAVVGERCDSNKLRDLAAVELAKLGQLRHSDSRQGTQIQWMAPMFVPGAADCDFAFDGMSASISILVERMFAQAETVIKKRYPEQSILASLHTLRAVYAVFPKCVALSFQSREFFRIKRAFQEWLAVCEETLPAQTAASLQQLADQEFETWESILQIAAD